MKISKAKLIEIIKEEIEESIGVYGNPRMAELPGRDFSLPGRDFGPSVEKGKPQEDVYSQMLGIIKARLGNAISDKDAEQLAKSLEDTLSGAERKTQVEFEEEQT
tara:strand:+ start:61 stop:375 length:315 start_codon:yes stop_codon:yes gene_type:complete